MHPGVTPEFQLRMALTQEVGPDPVPLGRNSRPTDTIKPSVDFMNREKNSGRLNHKTLRHEFSQMGKSR